MISTPVLAIDPGTTHSGVVLLRGMEVIEPGIFDNIKVLDLIHDFDADLVVAIETMFPRGMAMSIHSMQTLVWVGQFKGVASAYNINNILHVDRLKVKMHVCGKANARDSNIRQALIDQWGGKEKAIGNKKTPGPLHTVKKDAWQALAVAVTVRDNLDHYLEHSVNGYLEKELVR